MRLFEMRGLAYLLICHRYFLSTDNMPIMIRCRREIPMCVQCDNDEDISVFTLSHHIKFTDKTTVAEYISQKGQFGRTNARDC